MYDELKPLYPRGAGEARCAGPHQRGEVQGHQGLRGDQQSNLLCQTEDPRSLDPQTCGQERTMLPIEQFQLTIEIVCLFIKIQSVQYKMYMHCMYF